MRNFSGRAWLSWVAVGLLAVLCGVLGLMQYRAIREIAAAERSRLKEDLRSRLEAFSRALNERISAAMADLVPEPDEIDRRGREQAYAARYDQWKRSHGRIFARIALAVPREQGEPALLNLDLNAGTFLPAEWPAGWRGLEEFLIARLRGEGRGPATPYDLSGLVFEIPRFGSAGENRGPREQEWLIVELNTDYLRGAVLPEMADRYLGGSNYDVEVADAANPETVLYSSLANGGRIPLNAADASVGLLDIRLGGPRGGPGDGGPRGRGPFRAPNRSGGRNFRPPPLGGAQGRWHLLARNRAGSLEALVAQTQRRNVATSAAVLLLILATAALLVRFSRQSQKLAEMQINFVAGISHELRTPLTVIRTAAYNLTGNRFRDRPDQVDRYAHLIEDESRKLEGMVEQVLQFASANAGHAIRDRVPTAVDALIHETLDSSRKAIESRNVVLDEHIGRRLPIVLADGRALRHAIQNLLDNALKYGVQGANWIGVYAEGIIDEQGAATVIRVSDHGPGIPPEEQHRIFDPFFRGSRAVQGQVHGTGLGLNLVKTIVEAHGGTINVRSEPAKGTEFTIRIPAAPAELQNEFAYSAD